MTSAFVIYIQPQLQVDANEETTGLVRVLIYKTDSTTFGGAVPVIPQWNGPSRKIISVLLLLYLGLIAQFVSVLFAILTKQLLHLYADTNTSGSDMERGTYRRRTFDWLKLSIALLVFALPLLLEISLLFLSVAATTYLWSSNVLIAGTILAAILCCVPIYLGFAFVGLVNIRLLYFQSKRKS